MFKPTWEEIYEELLKNNKNLKVVRYATNDIVGFCTHDGVESAAPFNTGKVWWPIEVEEIDVPINIAVVLKEKITYAHVQYHDWLENWVLEVDVTFESGTLCGKAGDKVVIKVGQAWAEETKKATLLVPEKYVKKLVISSYSSHHWGYVAIVGPVKPRKVVGNNFTWFEHDLIINAPYYIAVTNSGKTQLYELRIDKEMNYRVKKLDKATNWRAKKAVELSYMRWKRAHDKGAAK